MFWMNGCWLGCMCMWASTHPQKWVTTDDGLPQSNVTTILRDHRGFLWMTTGSGLVRYDGTNIKTYYSGTNYPFSLVHRILEVKPDVFWVSDFSKGIWELHFDSVKWIPVADPDSNANINEMIQIPDGRVVVALEKDGGFYIVDPETRAIEHFDSRTLGLGPDLVSLAGDVNGTLYLGSETSGLYVWRSGQIIEHLTEENGLPSNTVRAISVPGPGQLWVGTSRGLYIRGEPERSASFNQAFDYCPVLSFFRETDTKTWISTIEGGGGIVLFEGNQFKPYWSGKDPRTTSRSNCVYVDQEGTLFIGSSDGLVIISHHHFLNYDQQDGLSDPYLRGLAQDTSGRIWVGSKQSGLFYQDQDQFLQFPMDPQARFNEVNTLRSVGDEIWVGTRKGLMIIRGNQLVANAITEKVGDTYVRQISPQTDGSILLTGYRHIFRIQGQEVAEISYNLGNGFASLWGCQQHRDGFIYAATNGHGLFRLEGTTWLPVKSDLSNADGLLGIVKQANGDFLMPSKEGAFCFDGRAITPVFDLKIPVWDIFRDRQGVLWIGTSQGLYRDDGNTMNCYNREMGFAMTECNMRSILEDQEGNLWFGGIGGLVKREMSQEPFKNQVLTPYLVELITADNHLFFPNEPVVFDHANNHVQFRLSTPVFRNTSHVEMRYKLEGFDQSFKHLDGNFVQYTNLPAGQYQFVAQARFIFQDWPDHATRFSFRVKPPLFLSQWAFAAYALGLIALIWLTVRWRVHRLRVRNLELEQRVSERVEDIRKANLQLQQEILERASVEAALHSEKENLATTLKALNDGVLRLDPEDSVQMLNREALILLGKSEGVIGQPVDSVVHLLDTRTHQPLKLSSPDLKRRLIEKPEERLKAQLVGAEGRSILVHLSGSPIQDASGQPSGFLFILRNIEKESRMEAELFRSQKLDSLGVLAGGLAHDFNNILSGILGNAQLAGHQYQNEPKLAQYLEGIAEAASTARALTTQLLTFAKGGQPVKELLCLEPVVEAAVIFSLHGTSVTVQFDFDPDLPMVLADKGQIHLVLNNLVINSCQAMNNSGHIHVLGKLLVLAESNGLDLPAGRYVQIQVQDNGPGIPEALRSKVFDPFFSTKAEGSGLGLASCHSIVEQHGGVIRLDEVASGASFSIFLPASAERKVRKLEQQIKRGTGHVLIMDDEDLIRSTLSEILQHIGYSSESVAEGSQAIEAYRRSAQNGKPFDVVIMDWTIKGGLGGEETIGRLLAEFPQAKVIVTSGYSTKGALSHYRDFGFVGLLPKPYKIQELSHVLSQVLSQKSLQ